MKINSVYINNIQTFLPGLPVANDQMEDYLGLVGDKPSRARKIILKSNGIKSRYYAIDPKTGLATYSNAQLTSHAIKKLADDNFDINQIGCLATGTSSPDQLMPNHGVMVQGELGNNPCEVVATSGICISGMSALKYAFMSVATQEHQCAVATGSEISSSMMKKDFFLAESEYKLQALEKKPEIAFEKDFLRWMLSDGAGAALLQNHPNKNSISLKIEWIEMRSYANEMEACMYAGAEKVEGQLQGWTRYSAKQRAAKSIMAVKQDVKLLNANVVVYTVEKPLQALVKKYGLCVDDISWFIPHYSSTYFRDRLSQGLKNIGFDIPMEKWFTNLTEKGNTGAASIYIMLAELMVSNKLNNGEKILCYIPESGRFSACFMLLTAYV